MEFHVNHPVLFLLAGILIAAVLGQSVYFLLKALKLPCAIKPSASWFPYPYCSPSPFPGCFTRKEFCKCLESFWVFSAHSWP